MRGDDDVVEREQRIAGRQRLDRKDVHAGAGDPAFRQGAHQGRLVDDRPARDVDEIGIVLHLPQLGRTDQPPRLGRQHAVDRDEIGAFEERVEGDQAHPVVGGRPGRDVGVVGDERHGEAGGAARHGAADGAEADQAEGLAGEIDAADLGRRPDPAVGPGRPVDCDDPARQADEQRKGVIGHRVRAVFRAVDNHDAARARRREVDIVGADAVFDDRLQPGRRGDDPGRYGREERGDDVVRVGRRVGQGVLIPDRRRDDLGAFAEPCQVGDAKAYLGIGPENPGLGGGGHGAGPWRGADIDWCAQQYPLSFRRATPDARGAKRPRTPRRERGVTEKICKTKPRRHRDTEIQRKTNQFH